MAIKARPIELVLPTLKLIKKGRMINERGRKKNPGTSLLIVDRGISVDIVSGSKSSSKDKKIHISGSEIRLRLGSSKAI
jgi:hypothetical protein